MQMIGQGASVHEASLHKPGVDAMDGLSPLHACCLGAEFDNSGGHVRPVHCAILSET